jgi:hypothetical protein
MWKRVDEIPAYNESQGLPKQHDPFSELNTVGGRVDGLFLEGDTVVLVSCCETLRLRREDVVGWRPVQSREGTPLYEVRVRLGAQAMAQRAVVIAHAPNVCEYCGRTWDGPPLPRGEHGPDVRRRQGDYPGRPREAGRECVECGARFERGYGGGPGRGAGYGPGPGFGPQGPQGGPHFHPYGGLDHHDHPHSHAGNGGGEHHHDPHQHRAGPPPRDYAPGYRGPR